MKALPFAAAALLAGTSAWAQDRTAEIDELFRFATSQTPGCAVGVSHHGRVLASRAYGLADVQRRLPLTPSSRFDIGSTQKQFVAAAVLLLAEQGRLSLSDDVRKHLPQLPDYGHTVTVDHLLTHTSGVRDWTGLLPMAPEGTDVLTLILRQRGLNFTPGEQWSYSNSGYVLLKEIVARVSGVSFAEFARTRLFEPLGMRSSAYVPDVLQAGPDASHAYQKDGAGWKPYMRLGNNRGGGAIVSTVGDLLTWNDALASGKLGRFVTGKLQEPARLSNGRELSYARGLIVETNRGRRMVWHSGGAAGYSTLMSRFPDHGLSVAVACNFDPVSATALAARVADLYLPAPPAAAESQAAAPARVPDVDVGDRAGLYFHEQTGEPVRLLVQEGRLRIANGPALVAVSRERFRPQSAGLFFRSQDRFEMSFPSDEWMEIRSMEGEVTRFRRAQPWTPTSEDLQSVGGRYRSEELASVLEILPGTDGGIVMRLESTPERALTLTPVERDAYMLRMMIVRFVRDAGGRVVALDYGNPLVRNLRFARLGDRAASADAPAQPAAPPAAAPRLEGLVGEYRLAPGRTVAITLEEGRLHGQPTGSPKRPLAHVSGGTFEVVGAPAGTSVTFTLDPDGRASEMVMRQGGSQRTLTRVR